MTNWEAFDAATTPGDVIALVEGGEFAPPEAFGRGTTRQEGVHLGRVGIVRDYGMFDRREVPQSFAEVHPRV